MLLVRGLQMDRGASAGFAPAGPRRASAAEATKLLKALNALKALMLFI
jgi:hypothetical protein